MGNEYNAWRYNSDYLYHYGIRGQKWGERNFQNEDGSLTAAGKIRYGVGQGLKKAKEVTNKKITNVKAKRQAKKDARPESTTWKSKEAKYLSEAELNRRNNRLQKEEQYKRMTESRWSKRKRGFKTTLSAIAVGSAVGVGKELAKANYKKLFNSIGKTQIAKAGKNFIKEHSKTLAKNIMKNPAVKSVAKKVTKNVTKWAAKGGTSA